MINLTNLEFYAHNSARAYPLSANASGMFSGNRRLPDDFLLGISLSLSATPEEVPPDTVYIDDISVHSFGALISISYAGGKLCSCGVEFGENGDTYAVFPIVPTPDNPFRITGNIYIGSGRTVLQNPGVYSSTGPDISGLETDCITYSPNVLHYVLVDGQEVTGNLVLKAGKNIKLELQDGLNGLQIVKIHSYVSPELAEAGLLSINGVTPDNTGNIDIKSISPCLEVTPLNEQHAIQLSETCSSPCCGCEELQSIVNEMSMIANGVVSLESYQRTIDMKIDQLMLMAAQIS